jgi:hypothetical protein
LFFFKFVILIFLGTQCEEAKKKKKTGEAETPLLWIEIHYTPAVVNKEAQQLAEGTFQTFRFFLFLFAGKLNAKTGKPKMTKSFTVMEGDEKTSMKEGFFSSFFLFFLPYLLMLSIDSIELVTEADVLREYELGEVLGSGATAVVKLGIQKRDNKKVCFDSLVFSCGYL